MDTLRVWGDACNDENVVVKTLQVYVKPASVVSIEHPACVSAGDSVMFRAVLGNNGVAPVRYHWSTSDNINLDMFTGDSVIFAPTSATTTVSVQPMGAVCAGDTCTDTLSFVPIAPTGIVSSGCIAYNMPDTVTFSIVNPIENQQYAWIYPENWTLVASRDNGSEIDLRTVGIAGAYTVGAYSVGEGECGNSAMVVDTFYVDSIGINIGYAPDMQMFTSGLLSSAGTNFRWYYVYNGTCATDTVFQYPFDNRIVFYADESYSDVVGTTNSVVLEFTNPSGCRVRAIRGADLDPSVDYLSQPCNTVQNFSSRKPINRTSYSIEMVVSPNPASTELNVSLSNHEKFDLKIATIDGNLIYNSSESNDIFSLNVSTFNEGVYVLLASQDGKHICYSKFLKQ